MGDFKYGDETISSREIMIALPAVTVGVGILSLPREIALLTIGADGWIALLVAGIMITLIVWMTSKLAASYPGETFLSYSSKLVTKPVSILFSLILVMQSLLLSAYVIRVIAEIAKAYLFDRTPLEVISLTFLLVVVYAVSGSRAGLFRLNMLFFPIIVLITFILSLFSFGWFEMDNLFPIFETGVRDQIKASEISGLAFVGFNILFFYITLVKDTKKVPKASVYGMLMVIGLYLLIFFINLGVFGNAVTGNLVYPLIELAKEIEIPGGFFERFDSFFFVIWIMSIFNTTTMSVDVSIYALQPFIKLKKQTLLFCMAPLIYIVGMIPEGSIEVAKLGTFIGYFGIISSSSITLILFTISKIRRGRKKEDATK
ncbi:Spore germination protein YndE [Oceanobacillus picturae]|uniref:Spore germination protein YndE n=1 Tax=Oceanobacillus picturae TaxID=171693 RepID=W9BD09_9BACI|nr:endospore germination permease [Oceanobacillus picturae]CDO04190.1 Spore germination protein YndE [Oceanobacillus picturae]